MKYLIKKEYRVAGKFSRQSIVPLYWLSVWLDKQGYDHLYKKLYEQLFRPLLWQYIRKISIISE